MLFPISFYRYQVAVMRGASSKAFAVGDASLWYINALRREFDLLKERR